MSETEKESKKLPKQVKALGAVSLVNDSATEMVFPLMPAFVSSVLGLGPEILGIMEGLAETIASLLKYFSGLWSDKLKKRKVLAVGGYALSSFVRPLIGFATAGWHIIVLRSFDRIGKGVRTSPRDALLAASVSPEIRGKAFGFHRAMDNAGAVLGPMIALAVLGIIGNDLRTLFFLTVIPGILTVLLLIFGVEEKAEKKADEATEAEAPKIQVEEEPKANKKTFTIFLISMVLFTLGNSSDVLLVYHAQELGIPVALAPVLWIVLHLSKTAFATPGGILSDKIGRKTTILMGWGVYALAYVGFALANSKWQMWALFVFYGLYYGLTEGPEKALTADLAPRHKRGKGFGLYHASVGIAALPASAAAGFLWEQYSASVALGMGACFAALAALVFAIGMPPK